MEPGSARKLQLQKQRTAKKTSSEHDCNEDSYRLILKVKRKFPFRKPCIAYGKNGLPIGIRVEPTDWSFHRTDSSYTSSKRKDLEFSRTTKLLIGVAVVTLLALGLYFQ